MLLLIPAPRWSVLLEEFFGYGDRSHRAGPTGVKRQMGDRFDQLILCYAVLESYGEVGSKLVGDFLHPVDDLAVELFLDGDVGHGGGRRGAMPMLLACRARDNITRSNDLDRPAPALHKTAAGRHDERLTQRMRVPIAPRAGLERYVGAARAS